MILMLVRAIAELTMDEGTQPRTFLEFIGTPAVALLLAVLVAMFFLGYSTGMSRKAWRSRWAQACRASRASC